MDRLLTTAEAAKLLGMKPITLIVWRSSNKGPKYIKIGHKTVRYRKEDVENFIKNCESE